MTAPPNPPASARRSRLGRTHPPIRIRTEVDVLALVPYTLGFHPASSAVLITIGAAGRPFLARVDLPPDVDGLAALASALVVPALRNGGGQAIVVLHSEDAPYAARVAEVLHEAVSDAGMQPLATLRTDGRRWHRLSPSPCATGWSESEGVAYDLRTHELTTRSVVEGRVTYADRRGLSESLETTDGSLIDEVRAAHAALGPLPGSSSQRRFEVRWAVAQLTARRTPGSEPGPTSVARLLRAVADVELRDGIWCAVTRADAAVHARAWSVVVRSSPEELVAPAAGLLAFCAWLSGDGALAWCAVERARRADPEHTLARLVGDALEHAVPPSTWTGLPRSSLPLFGG